MRTHKPKLIFSMIMINRNDLSNLKANDVNQSYKGKHVLSSSFFGKFKITNVSSLNSYSSLFTIFNEL